MGRTAPISAWGRPPDTLPAVLSVAVLIAAFGSLLVHGAEWRAIQVGTALAGYALAAGVVAIAAAWHLNGASFGLANKVTLLRTGMVCLIGGALLADGQVTPIGWSLTAVIAFALSLDAADGWLARRLGLVSRFGARFDLEVDALLMLILSILVWQSGRAGPWVLAIGALRYLFVALGILWPAGRRPLPPSFRRKAVCGLLGAVLLLCLLPPTPAWLAAAAAALALAGQAASFGIDLVWLGRHAGGADVEPA